ncbi:MAG: protein kinase [Peptococcaceae bacterium]|nr:protein kinase [Peptococcaceae bacterium]
MSAQNTMSSIQRHQPLWGAWTIEELIGEGSFGKVYKVSRREFEKTYYSAVKIISIPQDKAEIQRMKLEGLDNASISELFHEFARGIVSEIELMHEFRGNSNIVSLEDHMIIENPPPEPQAPNPEPSTWDILIRMELLKSLSLHAAETPLTPAEVVKLGVHICRALELCTRKNIIHRDIKPENIFISPHGEYKLGDFGVARQIEQTISGLSRKGTYMTMAPEVFKGAEYGADVDIYALGIVMYILLNQNRAPFLPAPPQPIRPQDREDALQKRMKGAPIPELRLGDTGLGLGVSPELNALVLKACAYNRRERFADPTVMRKALEAVAAAEGYELGMEAISKNQSTDTTMQSRQATQKDAQDAQSMHDVPPGTEHVFTEAPGSLFNTIMQNPAADEQRPGHPDTIPTPNHKPDGANNETRVPSAGPSNRKRPLPLLAGLAAITVILALIGTAAYYFWGNLNNAHHGYGISVDEQIDIVLPNKKEAQAVLNELIAYYTHLTGAAPNAVSATYKEEVDVVKVSLAQTDSPQDIVVMNKQDALQALIDGKTITVNDLTFVQPYLHVVLQWAGEVTEEIDFETDTRKDDALAPDTREVLQEGEAGSKILTYNYVSRNGFIVENTLLDEQIIKVPVSRIILEGPKTTEEKPSEEAPPPGSDSNDGAKTPQKPEYRSLEGSYIIKSYNSGIVLNASASPGQVGIGTNVCIMDSDGTPEQKFHVKVYEEKEPGKFTYRIISLSNDKGYYIDVYGNPGHVVAGANVHIWGDTLSGNNIWSIEEEGGYYIIRNSLNSNLVLTAASSTNRANVGIQEYSPSNTLQKWKLSKIN